MRTLTIARELTAAGLLVASYPIDLGLRRVVDLGVRRLPRANFCRSREPVVLSHGFGGNRSNLLVLAAFLNVIGFDNLKFFEYATSQSIADSAQALAALVEESNRGDGVNLIGHSLGGTISRRCAMGARPGAVRSLVTLASPYRPETRSPFEVAVFGDEDPVVPPPDGRTAALAFARAIILPDTGHLGVLFHGTTLRVIAEELHDRRSNRRERAVLR